MQLSLIDCLFAYWLKLTNTWRAGPEAGRAGKGGTEDGEGEEGQDGSRDQGRGQDQQQHNRDENQVQLEQDDGIGTPIEWKYKLIYSCSLQFIFNATTTAFYHSSDQSLE
jgi:hypothetical protein